MVKDHSDGETENLLLPHGLLFPISSNGSFICTIPERLAYSTVFVINVVIVKYEVHQYNTVRCTFFRPYKLQRSDSGREEIHSHTF